MSKLTSSGLAEHIRSRILDRIASGPPPASVDAREISTDIYTDAIRHQRELHAMRRAPWVATTSHDLPTPGSVRTADLAGRRVILTRDGDGQVHAMENACAHRGSTVVKSSRDGARLLTCTFHGWSYNLNGSLRSITHPDLFSASPCTRGLRTLHCEERHGLIWVIPEHSEIASVAGWLGSDVDDILSTFGLSDMVEHASIDIALGCNWKLLTDGFLEIYHLKYLHRDSIAPYFPANFTILEQYGHHIAGWLPKNRLIRSLTEQRDDDVDVLAGLTGAIVLAPGTVIQWQAGHAEVFSLRPDPIDPSQSNVRLMMLVPRQRCADTELWDRNWDRLLETIPAEDFAAAEDVQANIAAGVAKTIQLGANEAMIKQHLDIIEALTRAAEIR